jgi:hypothetical protein
VTIVPLGALEGFSYADECLYVASKYSVSARHLRRVSTRDGERMVLARHALMFRLWYVFRIEPSTIARLMSCRRQTIVDGINAHRSRVNDFRLTHNLPPLEDRDASPR